MISLSTVNRRIAFAIASGWGSQTVTIFVNLVQIPLLYRFLDQEIIGIWFLMIGAQMLLGIFDLGFGQTLQRRIAFAKGNCGTCPDTELDEPTKQQIRNLLAIAKRFYRIISGIVFIILLIVGPLYFSILKLSPNAMNSLRIAWIIMSIGYAFNMWGWFVESTLNGLGDIGWSNIISSSLWIITLGATWLVLVKGGSLISLGFIWVSRGIFLRAFGWILVNHFHPWIRQRQGIWSTSEFRTMLEPSFKWWIAILGTFLLTGVTRFFIGSYLGITAVSDYIATFTALSFLHAGIASIILVTIPLQSQMWAAGNFQSLTNKVLRLSRIGLILTAVSDVFICLFGKEIFELWLGQGHFVGTPVVVVLAVTLFLGSHHGMLNTIAIAAEKLQFYKHTIIGGILNTVFILLLAEKFQLLGFAIAIFIAQLVTVNWIIPKISLNLLRCSFKQYYKIVLSQTVKAIVFSVLIGLIISSFSEELLIAVPLYIFCVLILVLILENISLKKLFNRSLSNIP